MSDFIEISIVDTAVKCGIWVSNNNNRVEIPVNCPFCADKKKHASLNVFKNLFHCHRCGEGHNPVTLYAKLIGVDTKTAYRELTSERISTQSYSYCESEREPKPLQERHSVYSEFLSMLSLLPKHKTHLLNRGLELPAIEGHMYRSVPDKAQAEYIAEILSRRYDLIGVPGFYTDNGKWRITTKDGLFIPIRDKDGFIQGLQIRLDSIKNRKYRWFSSRFKENGTRAYSWPHVVNWSGNKCIFITEGALKANVAAYLSGDSYIGLAGVNCINDLIPLLKQMGINEAVEAFDMDKTSNKHVRDAAAALKANLQSVGIACKSMYWDEMTNGVDDYYLFSKWLDESA